MSINSTIKIFIVVIVSIALLIGGYCIWAYFQNDSVLVYCHVYYNGTRNHLEEIIPQYKIVVYRDWTYQITEIPMNYSESKPIDSPPTSQTKPDTIAKKKLMLHQYLEIRYLAEKSREYHAVSYYADPIPQEGYSCADIFIDWTGGEFPRPLGPGDKFSGGMIAFQNPNDVITDEYYYLHVLLRKLVQYSPTSIKLYEATE